MTSNAEGWREIFSKLPIVETVDKTGFFDITADQIKAIARREPRLMAKIDFRERLPPVMSQHGLAMLAISNGTYRIGRFDPFIPIQPANAKPPQRALFPKGFLTLNPGDLAHESAALDAALLSGVLAQVFGETVALTIRGRTRKVPFRFALSGIDIPVDGVQIEVDGGYEGATTINLVEAKVGAFNNISVRQLLYPQLAWDAAIQGGKKVRTYICLYQEPRLRFIPVLYDGKNCMTDHSNEQVFIIEPEAKLSLASIPEKPGAPVPVLGVPFPQADNFETVLAMLNIVAQHEDMTKDELSVDFDLVDRQIDYYVNILRWLGLVKVDAATIHLTASGRRIAGLPHAERIYELAQIIFGEPVFHQALKKGTEGVDQSLFARWKCSKSTIGRRLQTVNAWIKYFKTHEK